MTAVQLNAELLREISLITDDESMLEKAIKAIRRIRTSHIAKSNSVAIESKTLPELPESLKRLRGMGHITEHDIANDDRLAYILSK